ncbi:unnamed protein product [Ceutorhynchus assimilis]|uniref:Uncharacterized protein n=1 Tax=Ceutorhynchus assimilis TaxID=467358 RepID=A0A9N9MZJ3_9CUCU|nr:unnamed protein product [Ceutorhynchus assimilis]
MILLSACLTVHSSEYPRFKRKGLQQSASSRSGPPQPPQYGKKWGKPPQKPPQYMQSRPYHGMPPPLRSKRPSKPQNYMMPGSTGFNMHLGQHQAYPMHNIPKFQPFASKNPSTTMKNYFKNPVQQYSKMPNHHAISSGQLIQFPKETKVVPKIVYKKLEKPSFMSSPSIPALEYDYHVQTNNIPMSANTIKQIGEKGPIHTIPAPNLTPADKPSNLDFRKPQQYHQHQEVRYQQPQYEQPQISHQYQVTEPEEQVPQFNQYDQFENQDLQAYQSVKSLYQQSNPGITVQETGSHGINIGYDHGQVKQETGSHGINIGYDHGQVKQDHEDLLNSKNYQNTQHRNLYTQAIQSSYDQQQPQILTQFAKPQSKYGQQYSQEDEIDISEEKNPNAKPEYHSFNYDEQAHRAQEKSGQQSGLVTATYSLGSTDDVIKGQNINSRSNSMDPLTQAQIVQNYFDTRSGNDVEPDAKPSASGVIEKEVPSKLFFSSLPNKEAADRLAKLQAAGKINSNLMHFDNKNRNQQNEKDGEAIFVSEDNVSDENQEQDSNKEQSVEYEDYSQEDESSDEKSGFGKKTNY